MPPAPTAALDQALQPAAPVPPALAVRTTVRGLPPNQTPDESLADHIAELRSATMRYARALREQGARPERMLPEVKAHMRAALSAEGWRDPEATEAVMSHVVRWSIEAYYDVTVRP